MSAALKQRIFDAVSAQSGTLLLDDDLNAILEAIRAEPLFTAGEADLPALRRLELLGLVRCAGGSVWCVTSLGGHVAGLSASQVATACGRTPAAERGAT